MNLHIPINKKLWLALLVLPVLFLIYFFLSHSVLTIQSVGDEERTVYIKKEGFEERIVLKNSSKRFFLPSGDYEIEATNQDSQSLYYRKLRSFRAQSLLVETSPPKASKFLGVHVLNCARENRLGSPLFYSCDPSTLGIIDTTAGAKSNINPVAENASKFSFAPSSVALKPFNSGFLEARVDNNVLSLKEKGLDGSVGKTLNIKDFSGSVSDDTLSTSGSGYAGFDNKQFVVYFLNDLKGGRYQRLRLDKELFLDEKPENIRMLNTDNFIYVLSFAGEEVPEGEEGGHANHASKIIIIDKKQSKAIKTSSLNPEGEIGSISTGPGDSLVLVEGGRTNQKIYAIDPGGKTRLLNGFKSPVQQICSINDGFYYLTNGGHSIYKYSVSKSASYLIYSNLANNVVSTSCVNDKLYFVLNNERGDEVDENFHYTLSENPQTGTRLDAVLPLYITVNQETIEFTEGAGGVTANLIYDADPGSVSSKDAAKGQLIKVLEERGVDAASININFSY